MFKVISKKYQTFNGKVTLCRLVGLVRFTLPNGSITSFTTVANGRAKLNPEDEVFDIKKGQEISYGRAYARLKEKVSRRLMRERRIGLIYANQNLSLYKKLNEISIGTNDECAEKNFEDML